MGKKDFHSVADPLMQNSYASREREALFDLITIEDTKVLADCAFVPKLRGR
jgi:hypothetical protein